MNPAPNTKFTTADEYISTFPASTQAKLQQLRRCILKAAPHLEEVISYNMPAYKQHGIVVYYAGYKAHIGFYPGAGAVEAFKKELSVYKGAKGSVQFPLDEPVPVKLVSEIVKFRVEVDAEKAMAKTKK